MLAALARAAPAMPLASTGARTMKVKASVKKICEGCRLVKRERVLYVYCDRNPKHKQVSDDSPPSIAHKVLTARPFSQRQGFATMASVEATFSTPPPVLAPVFK